MVEFSDLFDGELEEFQKKAKVSPSSPNLIAFKQIKPNGLLILGGLVFVGFDYNAILWFL